MGFKKGQSGNPGGRSTEKPWRDAILLAVNERGADKQKKLRALAAKLVDAGLTGDVGALRELGDRIDGKPVQAIVGDSEKPPVQLEVIERRIVDPKH